MEHTICAVSTAIGQGGIGIVRISGSHAIEIGKRAFQPKNTNEKPEHRNMVYGHITDADGRHVDEVLI